MRLGSITLAAVLTLAALAASPPRVDAQAQTQAAAAMAADDIVAYAKVQIAIGLARDSVQAQLALSGNKKPEAQQALQEKLQKEIEEILHHAGMSDADYQRKTFLVSSTPELRKTFDSVVVAITGVPVPGQAPAAGRAGGAPAAVPAGPVGAHIGHVLNAFGDTPNGAGLLPTAMAESRTAAQHAELAARDPNNLDAMKLHAGHVIHALDPSVVPMGPGLGYGVKKAATAVAAHIELAANADGATVGVMTHSGHVATSARNTVKRADQIVELAKQLRAASSAPDAAKLLGQIVSLCGQLVAGADANGDGQITWVEGEGGLQQADEHMTLLLRAAGA